jgi:hypothetical protein
MAASRRGRIAMIGCYFVGGIAAREWLVSIRESLRRPDEVG